MDLINKFAADHNLDADAVADLVDFITSRVDADTIAQHPEVVVASATRAWIASKEALAAEALADIDGFAESLDRI